MDLNDDGRLDILSGSYSRHSQPMAGLFQVLWGKQGGGYRKPEVLKGIDGEPLIITSEGGEFTDFICTRPTAADLDADGDLDLVVGNFSGTFAVFLGEGQGRFAAKSAWLHDKAGKPLMVSHHSDPFLVDWDGDGDLDILSGSSQGAVSWFENCGSKQKAAFKAGVVLVDVAGRSSDVVFGDKHIQGPVSSTRVYVDDVNGDGKLDLLVGDQVSLKHIAKGLDEPTAKAKLASWNKEQVEIDDALAKSAGSEKEEQRLIALWQKHREKSGEFMRSQDTGFVWVYLRK